MDVRKLFLDYFSSKGHTVYESMPLVPDDPTLLFTNAGMVQFKDIFTGKIPAPKNRRATSCQLCMRAGGKHNDLENVGYTSRHHTLFEMLGNFSFGDYFKEQAIDHAWEFVTDVLGFSKDVLWVTVHDSDDEAFNLWLKHVSADRIKRMGDKDNFWQMGDTGPCGPCSEIFVDQGEEKFHGSEDYFGGDGDRFLEIWNLVFMQYERSSDGTLTPLPKPSIDTGMGLERVVALKEGKSSNFDSSLFMPMINKVAELTAKPYVYESGASYRVIADHIRAISLLLAQGVNFDKEGRGYVLRRILRRAVRHGYLLGLSEPFLYKIADVVCDEMGGCYSYLNEKRERIKSLILDEEERFFSTIAGGMEVFKKELENTKEIFSGEAAFRLYDTFGFPLDLTEDMLREKGIAVDLVLFEECMKEQKERAKAAWKGSGDELKEGDFSALLEEFGVNSFVGYGCDSHDSSIVALLNGNYKRVDSLKNGEVGYVMLKESPLYAESGGQCGDSGEIFENGKLIAVVLDTRKYFGLNISQIEARRDIKVGDNVHVLVSNVRNETKKHHSATHLLHATLRKILGDHVAQAGSLVEPNRLRFDFSHSKALSGDELERIEDEVNRLISLSVSGRVREMPIDEAKKSGAMALFGEKYGDVVRVVDFGDFSIELCGGTHVENSAQIGSFYITKESGVSAGVRRIEAVCGDAAYRYGKGALSEIATAKELLKAKDLMSGISKLKEQLKELKSELSVLESAKSSAISDGEMVDSVRLIVERIGVGDIKNSVDEIKNRYDNVAVLLVQERDEKVMIAAGIKGANLKAGAWIKEVAPIVGGGGGGRDDFAQAGGKDSSKIDELLKHARIYALEALRK